MGIRSRLRFYVLALLGAVLGVTALLFLGGCATQYGAGVYGQFTTADGVSHPVYATFQGSTTPPLGGDPERPENRVGATVYVLSGDACTYENDSDGATIGFNKDMTHAVVVVTKSTFGNIKLDLTATSAATDVSVPAPSSCTAPVTIAHAVGHVANTAWTLARGGVTANGEIPGEIGTAILVSAP
ncbi:MAG: hypothetical protein ACYDGR_09480 [Candidatus Dormibacteria bacterium]